MSLVLALLTACGVAQGAEGELDQRAEPDADARAGTIDLLNLLVPFRQDGYSASDADATVAMGTYRTAGRLGRAQ